MITTEALRAKRNDITANELSSRSLGSHSDVFFFRSELLNSPLSPHIPILTPNLLVAASSELTVATDKLKRTLRAISKKGSDEQLGKFPNQLSNALFQSQILVKSLGKTTQCIDKICNLQ